MKKIETVQKVFLYLSIPQAIETLKVIVVYMIVTGGVILFWNNPLYLGILLGISLAIAIFAIATIFVNRKEVKKSEEEKKWKQEDLEKGVSIKGGDMHYSIRTDKRLPVIMFPIVVEKKINMELRPQKILLELTCDSIPLKKISWDRDYNIDGIEEGSSEIDAPNIEAIGDGKITIEYPCVNVFYNHDYVHEWVLKGKVTYHSKIGDINRKIELTFQLDKKKEEKLKNAIRSFHRVYVEGKGAEKIVS